MCVEDCLAVRNHLAVRDVLRDDEGLRDEYARVKMELAEREWEDDGGAGYGAGKSQVLEKILRKVGIIDT